MRGLDTAGRTFETELASGSSIGRNQLWDSLIAHSPIAGHSRTLAAPSVDHLDNWGCQSGMTASDQHQPANSRAIATLAITGRFLRASKPAHRECRRRLAACPRARTAGEARSQRRRISAPGRYRVRWCQAASTSRRRTCPLPVLVTPPWLRESPEEYSLGTNPTEAPMERPVNRRQSPISTANPNA